MSIYERLNIFLEHKSLNTYKFERLCGLSNGSMVKLSENTRRSTYEKISNTFPELNIDWLKTGEGEMLNPGASGVGRIAGGSETRPTTLDKALDEIAAQRRMMEKSQEQIDRLLSIIERMNGGK